MTHDELVSELCDLIVKELQLEDIQASDIDPQAPLFGDGLGLDSIDALELSIAIDRTFGVTLQPDDADQRKVFASVDALARFIQTRKASE